MINTNVLFYKIYKGIVISEDYIDWAICMLMNDISTPSLDILASFTKPFNIFEVQDYSRRALKELGYDEPDIQESARDYIKYLSHKIINREEDSFALAYEIFGIVSSLSYPNDLMAWYDISEMIDEFNYDNTTELKKEDVNKRIIKQAKIQISS